MIKSDKIAKILDTNHRDLLVKIRKLKKEIPDFEKGLKETTYLGVNGRHYKCYLLKEKAAIYLAEHHRNKDRTTLNKIRRGF